VGAETREASSSHHSAKYKRTDISRKDRGSNDPKEAPACVAA
jgi:hypothetical protein